MSGKRTITKAQEFSESIINTVHEPLIALDQDLRVVKASRSFYEFFKVKPEETLGQLIYDLGNRQWDIPKLRELLETILPQKATFDNYEVKHDFATIGKRTMLLNARQIRRALGKERIILLAIEDITERKQLQEEMEASEERYRRAFYTSQNVLLLVHKTEGDILNSNKSAQGLFGYSEEELLKKKLWELGVVKSYEDYREEVSRSEKEGAVHYEEILIKTKQGLDIKAEVFLVDREKVVQCNIRDITERKRTEEALRLKEERYRELFDNISSGVAVYKAKDNGEDFFFVDFNKAGEKLDGDRREDLIGRSIYKARPGIKEYGLVDVFKRVWKTGTAEYFPPKLYQDTRLKKWYENFVYRLPTGEIVALYNDVTESKRAAEALRESEEKFRRIFEDHSAVKLLINPDSGKIIDANKSAAVYYGWSREELKQMKIDQINTLSPEEVKKEMEKITSQKIIQFDFKHRRKDGSIRDVEVFSSKIKIGNKYVLHSIIHDITERKRAEEALINERNLLSSLMNNIPDHIYFKDLNSHFLRMSKSQAERFGLSDSTQGIGKTDFDFFTEEHARSAYKNEQEIIKTGISIVNKEEKETWFDGHETWVSTTEVPLIDINGQIIGTFGISRDMTEKKKMQNQLMQTQKVQSIGTLAGGIAHDFNNILGIIMAYSSVLERVGSSNLEKFTASIKSINSAVNRGAALVKQILTFARQTDISIRPMSVTELVHEVVIMLQETFPEVIEFEEEFGRGIPLISADHSQMHQTILNLCVNARDAMPKGGIIRIKIHTLKLDEVVLLFPTATYSQYVHLSVSDTGIGMDETTKSRIFDPFFTTKDLGKGTGLGLSVVYGIMQSHYGFVSVDSEVGKGTTFHLYLPVSNEIKKVQEEPRKKYDDADRGTETILFIEDEELLRTVVASTLESSGYTVHVAVDGQEAVEVFKEHQKEIALVLTDIGLPKQSGADVFHQLREINPKTKIILASGFVGVDQKSELLKAGAYEFIQKPYVLDEVLQKIRDVLDEK